MSLFLVEMKSKGYKFVTQLTTFQRLKKITAIGKLPQSGSPVSSLYGFILSEHSDVYIGIRLAVPSVCSNFWQL